MSDLIITLHLFLMIAATACSFLARSASSRRDTSNLITAGLILLALPLT
jgi:hypothetical protein